MHTLLLGGARSGKSTLAVQMAERQALPVTYLATAEPFDADLAERVRRHRDERPANWTTVEEPLALGDAVRAVADDGFLVVDCLTVWVGNLFARHPHPQHEIDPAALAAADDLLAALAGRGGPTVIVSNEVGMGVHPATSVGRVYRDELGRLNQRVAATAHTTLLLVAGRAIRLDDPWELLS